MIEIRIDVSSLQNFILLRKSSYHFDALNI